MKNKLEPLKDSPFVKIFGVLFILGPGIIASTLNNDAAGLVILGKLGQNTEHNFVWFLIPMTLCLMATLEMSLRLGTVTGKGLADLIRERFGAKVTFYSFLLLLLADFFNIAAEIAGVAMAGEILGISRYQFVPLVSLFLFIVLNKGTYKIVEKILLFGSLLLLTFILTLALGVGDWNGLLYSVTHPNLNDIKKTDLKYLYALIGTTVTPWMVFYFQSSVIEKRLRPEDYKKAKYDIVLGGLLVLLISASVVILSSSVNIGANDQGLIPSFSVMLSPIFGKSAQSVFALLLLNASLFSAILLPLAASYYICEGLGLPAGLDNKFSEAPHFFGIIGGLLFFSSLVVMISKTKLMHILVGSQIFSGLLVPLILLFLLKLCNDQELMGTDTNKISTNLFYLFFLVIFILTNFYVVLIN
jgi:Mn2+/Fe2+ NRAMP family transporter